MASCCSVCLPSSWQYIHMATDICMQLYLCLVCMVVSTCFRRHYLACLSNDAYWAARHNTGFFIKINAERRSIFFSFLNDASCQLCALQQQSSATPYVLWQVYVPNAGCQHCGASASGRAALQHSWPQSKHTHLTYAHSFTQTGCCIITSDVLDSPVCKLC